MAVDSQLAPQIEQFIHDNPQGVLTSFRRNGMPQLSIVTVYPRDGGVGVSITETRCGERGGVAGAPPVQNRDGRGVGAGDVPRERETRRVKAWNVSDGGTST